MSYPNIPFRVITAFFGPLAEETECNFMITKRIMSRLNFDPIFRTVYPYVSASALFGMAQKLNAFYGKQFVSVKGFLEYVKKKTRRNIMLVKKRCESTGWPQLGLSERCAFLVYLTRWLIIW